jgi:hypothetical protein
VALGFTAAVLLDALVETMHRSREP